MKRYTANFEVVDGSTGNRYLPGEIITIDETDEKWRDTIPLLQEIAEPSRPIVAESRTDVLPLGEENPSPVADVKDTKPPRG